MSEHLSPYEYSPYLTEISKGELKYQMNSLHKGKAQVKYILFLFPPSYYFRKNEMKHINERKNLKTLSASHTIKQIPHDDG
jgi:hypothetical protein